MRNSKTSLRLCIMLLVLCPALHARSLAAPDSVGSGRELPRGEVIPYASRAEALAGGLAPSRYVQPLGEWVRDEGPDGVRFTTHYTLPFAWVNRRAFLHLGSVSSAYAVEINGRRAAYSQYGLSPVEFDITPYSVEGRNTLTVVVQPGAAAAIENGFCRSDAAIAGPAYVFSQPPVRVRDITLETSVEQGRGLLSAGIILKSHLLNPKEYRVYYELLAPTGEMVSYGHRDLSLDMRREDTVRFLAVVPDALTWSHEAPYLYTLLVRTQYEGRFWEYLAFPVGLRNVEADSDGKLRINGTEVALAAARYEAPEDEATLRADLEKLKQAGYNAVRVEKHPQPRLFYDLCDQLGLYVIDRAAIDTRSAGPSRRMGGNPSNDPAWEDAYLDRVERMYHTSKNHPSVIAFELAGQAANGYNLYESYLALKRLETARPILYEGAAGEWNSDRLRVEPLPADQASAAAIRFARQANGTYSVTNTRTLAPVAGSVHYTVRVGKRKVAAGSQEFHLAPGASLTLQVPLDKVKAGRPYTVLLRAEGPQPRYVYRPEPPTPPAAESGRRAAASTEQQPLTLLGETLFDETK